MCLLFVCFLREDDRVGLEKGGLHVEDEWRNTVGTGISLLLGKKKEQYILKSLAGGREGNIYPTEINRLNRKFQERGDKELHLSCSDP